MKWLFYISIVCVWAPASWADVVPGATRTFVAGITPDGDGDATWEEQSGDTEFEWTFVNGDQIVFDANDPLVPNLDAAYTFPAAAANGPGGNLLGSTADSTFEIWFKPEDLSGTYILLEMGGNGNGTTFLQDGNILYFISQTGSGNRMTTSLLLPSDTTNRFNQVVGTLDFQGGTSQMRLHLNAGPGVSDLIGAGYNNWAGSNGSGLGKRTGNFTGDDIFPSAGNLNGRIGIVRQYSGKALSIAEIQQNFDALSFRAPNIISFLVNPTNAVAGQTVTLQWLVDEADLVSIEPDLIDTAVTNGTLDVVADETAIFTLTATGVGGVATSKAQVIVDGQLLNPVLNEFVAENDDVFFDGDGNASDWIEIYNPNVVSFDLSGWYLTEDAMNLAGWSFPVGFQIPGDSYKVVFASGQTDAGYVDSGGYQHTTFRLRSSGEYLALVRPDFSVADEYAPSYPPQVEDVSYGRGFDGSSIGFLGGATPEGPNLESYIGFVADTRFSIDRGFYSNAFTVAITSETEEVDIRYTLDGSEPTESNGILYTNEIPIETTTTLRAAAFKSGFRPSNVDTQTYLFLGDVINQPAAPVGYPATWGTYTRNGTVFPTIGDYEMDPMVVTNSAYAAEMIPALKQIPTVSLTMSMDDWFDESDIPGVGGIYANPQKRGDDWEREVSMEFIYAYESNRNFQVNAGIRILGNITRNAFFTRKHTLRVAFREQYGTGRLKENIFDDTDVANFNKLVFRGHHGNSWMNQNASQRDRAQYIRDEWMHHAQRDMGWASIYGQYVHLYLNGLYWGLYNMVERPDADFAAAHFGGDPADYDAVNSGEALDGDLVAYNEMMDLADAGINTEAEYQAIQSLVNITNLTDYMILVMGTGERDWDGHNWYAGKHRQTGRYHWFCWDMEHAFGDLDEDVSGKNTANRPTRVFTGLRANPEYRLHFADRMRRHFYNGGVMTTEYCTNSWQAQVEEIDQAIVAESARWGDWRRDGEPYTRDVEWRSEQQRLYTQVMPARPALAFQQFVDLGLYPDVSAPDFSQWGGLVNAGYLLGISAPTGSIYYTLDGSDPREYLTGNPLGAVYSAPIQIDRSLHVKARTLEGSTWSALTEGTFTLNALSPLRIVELMYHPRGSSSTNYVESDYEYVELMNTGTNELGMAGIYFSGGIDFQFTGKNVQSLLPGERVLVVKNRDAFTERYGNSARIAGEFETIYNFNTRTFDNAGESIELRDGEDRLIQRFVYEDDWYNETDGDGFSLVVRDPGADTNAWNESAQWAASLLEEGTPGEAPLDGDFDLLPDDWELNELGGLGFDADSDKDGDGFRERGEWIAGTDPNNPLSKLALLVPEVGAGNMSIRWPSVSNRMYAVWQIDLQGGDPVLLTNSVTATPPENSILLPLGDVNAGQLRVSVEMD